MSIFLAAVLAIAALIGLWAAACLISALIKRGPLGLLKDYFRAVTGRDN